MTRHTAIAALLLLGVRAQTVGAQTTSDVVAYGALTLTPVGALSPLLTNTLIGRLQNGASLAFRYGHLSVGPLNGTTNGYAVTGILPASLGSSLSVTAGVVTGCDGCRAELMLGAGGDIRLYDTSLGSTSTSPLVTVSLDGELGYGNLDPGSAISGYVGVPIALVARGSGMQFVPFITPGFAFAQASVNGSSTSGSLTTIGGGVGIYNRMSNVNVSVGVQHPFVTSGKTMIGLAVMVGGK